MSEDERTDDGRVTFMGEKKHDAHVSVRISDLCSELEGKLLLPLVGGD